MSLLSFVVVATGDRDCRDRRDVSERSSSSLLGGDVGAEGLVGLRSIIH